MLLNAPLNKVQLVSGSDASGSLVTLGQFSTIQAALNAIPSGATSTTIRKSYSVLIPPGTYDEDLTIDITNRHIQLTALGPVNIGQFNNTFWAASNARNITIKCTTTSIDSIRSTLGIGATANFGLSPTTHPSYSTGIRVSGSIIWNVTSVGFVDVELYLAGEVFGDVDSSSSVSHNFHLYFTRARVRGQVKGGRNLIQLADWSDFTGLVTCRAYSTLRNSVFEGGMTVSQASSGGVKPFGMMACDFAGVFTGPAGSFALDNSTDYYYGINSASVAGGATKVYVDSTSGGGGITQLTGDVTAGPGSGSVVSAIAANAVTNAKMATMAANTVKANITGSPAVPTDAALLTTATNNSVAQRDSSGNLIATAMIAATHKPADGAGTTLTLSSGTAASGGNGGTLSVTGAVGSSVGAGGNGGTVNVTGGNANGDNTANKTGGNVQLTAGNAIGSSSGGTIALTSGTGGVGTGTAGANGGTLTLTGGRAGAGSATGGTGGGVTINGGAAATVDTSSGGSITLTGGAGSATSTGGNGGTININAGSAGGDDTVNRSGGNISFQAGNSKGSSAGGTTSLTGGNGGLGTGTAGATGGGSTVKGGIGGIGSATSGAGGSATLSGGTGGAGTGGGNGGQVTISGGTAGLGSSTGGNGGAVSISGGSSAAIAGSAGGNVSLVGSGGTSTGAGGAGGTVTLTGGAAGGDNTASNNGGSVTISSGTAKGSSNGAAINVTCGNGGLGTGAAGATGGALTLTGGNGGANATTSGPGGAININAGVGGSTGTPGAGGIILFKTASTTSLTERLRIAATGELVVTGAPVQVNTAGFGLQVKSGSNAKIGTATLVAGAVTVANTSVTANSRIFITANTDGGTPGWHRVSAKVVSTSFTITSSSATDTSVIAWMIVESL